MKKLLAVIMAITVCAAFLAGCGSKDPSNGNDSDQSTEQTTTEIKGETYDAGSVSALVPEGWKAFPVVDAFSDEENATVPDKLNVCKGGETDLDLFSHPYIQITYFDPGTDMMNLSSSWYDDPVELDPITTGDKTWNGFSAASLGSKLTVLWTGEIGGDQFQVTLWTETDNGTISLEDADVQAILSSIQPSA